MQATSLLSFRKWILRHGRREPAEWAAKRAMCPKITDNWSGHVSRSSARGRARARASIAVTATAAGPIGVTQTAASGTAARIAPTIPRTGLGRCSSRWSRRGRRRAGGRGHGRGHGRGRALRRRRGSGALRRRSRPAARGVPVAARLCAPLIAAAIRNGTVRSECPHRGFRHRHRRSPIERRHTLCRLAQPLALVDRNTGRGS